MSTKYIIKSNLTSLEQVNQKINDWMKNNITNYSAEKWGTIYKHPTEDKYALKVNEDSRNPMSMLTSNDKTKIVENQLSDDWFVTDEEGNKVLTKA